MHAFIFYKYDIVIGFYFFFQAEDGIRDRNVTGVQTCALPIYSPETHDNAALKVLVESGKLNEDSLGMILLRKTDWHDYEGIKWLLEQGVDPNRRTRWGKTALHNAILSDNALDIVEVLLDHGPARAKAPRRLPRPDQERNVPHPPRAGEQHHRAVAAGARGASARGGRR